MEGLKLHAMRKEKKSDYQRANHHSDLLQGLEIRFKNC